jgi:FkbM family methyltransferase
MRDYLQRRKNERAVFIDVGCSAGYHSLFLSRAVKQIHAFDPYLPAIERFRKMIGRNGFTNIRVHPVGLGDKDERLPFFEPLEQNFSTGTFRDRDDQQRATKSQLRIVRGDEWLAQYQLSDVELIKMDIEGFEQPALVGLGQILEKHRPAVVLEVTTPPGGTISSLKQLQSLFPKGYRFLIFLDNETTALDGRYQLIDFEPEASTFFSKGFQANLVAFPPEKQRQIPRSRPKMAKPQPRRRVVSLENADRR